MKRFLFIFALLLSLSIFAQDPQSIPIPEPGTIDSIQQKISAGAGHASENSLNQITRFVRIGGLLASLLIVFLTSLGLKVLHKLVIRLSKQFTQHRLILQKTETILQFLIYVSVTVLCFFISFHVNEKLLTIIGGTLAVALGFAVKDLLSSFIAGLMIMIDRPFQVGDRVTFEGHYGDIIAIGLRSVRMCTLSDDIVTIPNNKFLNGVTVSGNYGELNMQVVIDFYIGIDQDVDLAQKIISEAAASSHYCYLPKPVTVLVKQEIVEKYIAFNLKLKAYVLDTQYESLFVSDVNLRVSKAFSAEKIDPPAILYRNT